MSSFMLGIIGSLPSFIRQRIIPDMLIPEIVNNPSKVQLCRLSHAYFEHPDLKKFEKFAMDFGFVEAHRTKDTIYFRGYGKDQYVYVATKSKDNKARFMGSAFVAASQEEFDKAAKIKGAEVRNLTEAPGGGKLITIARPGDTFMHVIYGQKEREVDKHEATSSTHDSLGPLNTPFEKPRQGRFIHENLTVGHQLLTDCQVNSNASTKAQPSSTSSAISAMSAQISTASWSFIPPTSTSLLQISSSIPSSPKSTC